MANEDTKRAMSEAAKDAKAINRLSTAGLGEEELKKLKAKYKDKAYDLIFQAVRYPSSIVNVLGWEKFKKSSAIIKYFIDHQLTPEQIEKIIGKKSDNSKSGTSKSNIRTETRTILKEQRKESDKKEMAEREKAEAEAKKKAEAERRAAEEKASQARARKTNTPAPRSVDKSTTKVSDTLRCQIEKQENNGMIVFKSSVTDPQGVTIPELQGVTEYSMWEGAYRREVGTQKNPVGAYGRDKKGNEFWGAMQYNEYGIENVAMYALTKPEYEEYAKRFFKPGYKKALEDFKNYMKEKGKNVAYWQPNKYRSALKKFIKPEYIKSGRNAQDLVRQEGKNNPTKFLQIQRDFATEIYTSQHDVYKKIENALAKKGIRPEEVKPAVWELVLTSAIHGRTRLNAIAKLFERSNIDLTYINSANMIEDIRKADKSTFSGSGAKAIEHAKNTIHLKHSATTSRELAIILHEPEILANYEKLMTQNVTKVNGKYIARTQQPTQTVSTIRTGNTVSL